MQEVFACFLALTPGLRAPSKLKIPDSGCAERTISTCALSEVIRPLPALRDLLRSHSVSSKNILFSSHCSYHTTVFLARACSPCSEIRAKILLGDLIFLLSADCPWRDEPRGDDCRGRFSDLPPRPPLDAPERRLLRILSGCKEQ